MLLLVQGALRTSWDALGHMVGIERAYALRKALGGGVMTWVPNVLLMAMGYGLLREIWQGRGRRLGR